jgi:hypothetical protein
MSRNNLDTITAAQLLKITDHDPERLFSTPAAVHDEYTKLAKRFHPDRPA